MTVDTGEGPTSIEIGKNPKCSDFGLLQTLKTDEAPEGPLPQSGTKTYNTPYGAITVTTAVVDGAQTITDWSIDSENRFCIAKVLVKGGPEGGNVYSYDNADGDDDFTNDDDVGSQGDADTALHTPGEGDYDISHVSFCLSAETGDGCCFEPSTDHYLGLAWWLPTDVGNEVQSDSVAFNLGLRTVQCRNNENALLSR